MTLKIKTKIFVYESQWCITIRYVWYICGHRPYTIAVWTYLSWA